MSTLDERNLKALISNPANPNPERPVKSNGASAGGKPAFSQSTGSMPAKPKPSIKDTIDAHKKAAKAARAAGRDIPSRPGSAEPFGTPKKSSSVSNFGRPATAMSSTSRNVSTTSVGTLSSAPVRPRRRADIVRPGTADPYSSRKPTKIETPPRSPATSPAKRAKTPAPATSTIKTSTLPKGSPATNVVSKNPSPSKIGTLNGERRHGNGHANISPTKAAEDFTMVIPSLKPANSVDFTPPSRSLLSLHPTSSPEEPILEDPFSPAKHPTQNTDSPTKGNGQYNVLPNGKPYFSPTKLAEDLGNVSINGDKPQRISMSPRAIGSRKEAQLYRSPYMQGQRPLQVYEDPVADANSQSAYSSPRMHIPRALEELPVNEPSKNRPPTESQLLAEEPTSPEYHQKWLAREAVERRRISASENIENPRLARKILDSAIDRIRAQSLDVHGFRKLQSLIRTSGDSIWEGGYKFDELIMPLLELLEAPLDEAGPRPMKAQDIKTQDLVTIRLLLQYQPKYFSGHYPRAITAILIARKLYNSTSHIVCGLEETAESIVHECDPEPCIASVLDLLECQRTQGEETNTVCMGLYILAGLLHRGQERESQMLLDEQQEWRIGQAGSRFLADTNPDVRRAVIEFVLELHETIGQERFWGLVGGGKEDHRSLITYYLARKRTIAQ